MPRSKPIHNGRKAPESSSAARRSQGQPPKKREAKAGTVKSGLIEMPQMLYTDIPAVTKELQPSGQYQTKIDLDALAAVATTHASFEQLAQVFDVDEHVLYQPEYKAVIEKSRAMALVNLRASQFKSAIEDRNPALMIWLGKQFLGQKDLVQNQQLGADGKPINAFQGPTFVAFMPPNGRDLDQSRRLVPGSVGTLTDEVGVQGEVTEIQTVPVQDQP